MEKIEILAPAGSFDSVVAACVCGASSVYLGGKSLNARRNAGNFDYEELKKTVEYCHIHGVKVYLTLNIVMFDSEREELISAAKEAAEIGVDAIIVQDLGVLSILRNALPDMPLIASTQMAVHNLAGALEAEALGCSVVVLARELSKSEIKYIATNLHTAKVEVFAHGALCMSMSGQCYMSSMLGGRSGNRGLCAQPCRLPFAVGKSDHALSLKDLSLVERINELKDIPIHSLKIEGRMKRPEYVAAVVTQMRAALDGKKPNMDVLRSVFSRSGFTTAYFDGKLDKDMFGYRLKEDVISANDVMPDLTRLSQIEQPRIPLKAKFAAKLNEPISLACDEFKITGENAALAQNAPVTEEKVLESINKTGGTPFYFEDIKFDIEPNLFIPKSAINDLRRRFIDKVSENRKFGYKKKFINPNCLPEYIKEVKKPTLRIRCNAEQFSDELLNLCDYMIMPPKDVSLAGKKGIVEIPRIYFKDYDIKTDCKKAWCGNVGAIKYAKENGMDIYGGWSLNITNSDSLLELKNLGLKDTEISFETENFRIKKLKSYIPFGIIAYGYLPLMTYRSCPIKAAIGCEKCNRNSYLTDRMGTKFKVQCNKKGIIELFNSVPLYLADKLEEFENISFLTLYFTNESKEDCLKIAKEYLGILPINPPKDITRGLYNRTVY